MLNNSVRYSEEVLCTALFHKIGIVAVLRAKCKLMTFTAKYEDPALRSDRFSPCNKLCFLSCARHSGTKSRRGTCSVPLWHFMNSIKAVPTRFKLNTFQLRKPRWLVALWRNLSYFWCPVLSSYFSKLIFSSFSSDSLLSPYLPIWHQISASFNARDF